MKRFIFACIATAAWGCSSGGGGGGNACDGSLALGSWYDGSTDTMTFNANCSGTSSYCGSTFTVSKAIDAMGTMTVTTSATNGNPGCAPVGQMSCDYAISGNNLAFDCGSGALLYTKQ